MKLLKKLRFIAIFILLISCRQSVDNSRNNHVDISQDVIPFDTDSIQIGAGARIYTSDSLVIIKDGQSNDMLLTIIDIQTLKTKGQIAKFGPGPDEVAVPGAVFIDRDNKSISIFDYGQLKISSYNIDSALVMDKYCPTTISNFNNQQFPDRYVHVNDTLGFARSITIDPKKKGYTQGICRYNITTGELTDISGPSRMEGLKSLFGISVADRIIAEGATNNDILNIYDFNGRLLHEIKGPDYEPQVVKGKVFFREIKVIPDYILAAYSGRASGENAYSADRIHVYNHDGSYVKTLIIGKDITDMAYDNTSNRLFCIFNDENIQFGYIELDGIL